MIYIVSIIAVLVGFLVILILKPKKQSNLKFLLAFSGAFLLAITVFNLLPELFSHEGTTKHFGVWIMTGILLQKVLEYLSKGVEHGHIHVNKNVTNLPITIYISLCIHAILEGFPLHYNEDLFHGVVIHKIPVAMILSTFLIRSKISTPKTIVYLLLFSLMTPVGTWMAIHISFLQDFYHEITALVIGIFLHVSTTILFENNEGHTFNITKLLVILLATTIAYFL
ncbi:ZIP family metal transporter [Aquimarina sp. ERC-38]|nr:ZIP family metal transporter [Aquimarina sp. ERC-38]